MLLILQKNNTMGNLLEQVSGEIRAFLNSRNIEYHKNEEKLFYNECHLQMELASYLKQSKNCYDNVHLEYFVPGSAVMEQIRASLYPLDVEYKPQNLYIDIVVEKDGEFLPIELKYKTAPLNEDISRFGETIPNADVLKNHGARDLGAYDFWRDVNRIECLMKHFGNVKNGIALFLTNDQGYWTLPKKHTNPNYANFSMLPTEMCGVDKSWQGNTAMSVSRPSFKLEKGYPVKWFPEVDDKAIHSTENFRYCLLKI